MIAVLALLLASGTASAQNETSTYKTALGVKIWGDGGGISLKSFVYNNNALEGIGYFWRDGFRLTGLYEFHFDFDGAPGLKWYVGPGVHVSFYNDRYYNDNRYGHSYAAAGVDGVIGLDYKFLHLPLDLSLDWQPSYGFGDDKTFTTNWGGIGVRYCF